MDDLLIVDEQLTGSNVAIGRQLSNDAMVSEFDYLLDNSPLKPIRLTERRKAKVKIYSVRK